MRAELVSTDTNGVYLKVSTADGQTMVAQVDAAGEGVIRVRLSDDPNARSRAAAAVVVSCPAGYPEAIVEIGGALVRVHAGCLSAEVNLDPWRLRFLDNRGHVLVSEHPGTRDRAGQSLTRPFGRSGRPSDQAGAESVHTYHESFTAQPHERFTGGGTDGSGGSAVSGGADGKGCPLYLSSLGYGVLVDSGTPVTFDFRETADDCVQIAVPDDLLDYYVLAGPQPGAVQDRFNRLTCPPGLPPVGFLPLPEPRR